MESPDLGWLDICLRVKDFSASSRFYLSLGFQMVEGDPNQDWGVFVRGTARIGLFGYRFMGEDAVSLNFRGGNIPEIVNHLESNSIHPIEAPKLVGDQSGSARFRDPDGNLIFFDALINEVQQGS